MKRSPLPRGTKPLARHTPLDRGTAELERRTPIRKRNPERLARLEQEQFGEYGSVIAAQACWISGRYPVHRAHVVGTRGAGYGPEALAALDPEVHADFDDGLLDDEHFAKRYGGVSRADIRKRAVDEYAAWLLNESEAA